MKSVLNATLKKELKKEVEKIKEGDYIIKSDIFQLEIINAFFNIKKNNDLYKFEMNVIDKEGHIVYNKNVYLQDKECLYNQFDIYFTALKLIENYYYSSNKDEIVYINNSCITSKVQLFEKLNKCENITSLEIKDIILKMYNL